METIKEIKAREILDSRGNPTIEVDVVLTDGSFGRTAVPSGTSTGSHEATELRDKDQKRYGGNGVLKAVANVNTTIMEAIIRKKFDQTSLDKALIALDDTSNKSKLGANAILGVSMAFSHAMAKSLKVPLYQYFKNIANTKEKKRLPVPLMNILNGGKHAENSTDLQEFMVVPLGAPTFREALRCGTETFHALKKILSSRKLNTSVGDEGGYAPSLPTNQSAIEIIIEAMNKAGYVPGRDTAIAIDAAATEFYKDAKYKLKKENKTFNSKEMIEFYANWCKKYPIISIEDALAEDDWDGFKSMTEMLGGKIQIVGDDLFATNTRRLEQGIEQKAANAILIKPNQIGTITETIETVKKAKAAGYKIIISHRSGETEDTTIADLAVGLSADFIKTGAPSRGERIAKYNQLLRIEEALVAQSEI